MISRVANHERYIFFFVIRGTDNECTSLEFSFSRSDLGKLVLPDFCTLMISYLLVPGTRGIEPLGSLEKAENFVSQYLGS